MSIFHFKHFSISQANATMKVGTDAMLLGALISSKGKERGLDVGTGTGVLALMLAQRNEHLTIDALEIDQDASLEAKFNFDQSKWSGRLHSIQADILDFSTVEKYDLIFSNPPYYQNSLQSDDARVARAKHESFLPADRMLLAVDNLLAESGEFWIIVPAEHGQSSWVKSCMKLGIHLKKVISIHGKEADAVKRSVYCFSRFESVIAESDLTIRTSDGDYTDAYIQLTSEFHGVDLRK